MAFARVCAASDACARWRMLRRHTCGRTACLAAGGWRSLSSWRLRRCACHAISPQTLRSARALIDHRHRGAATSNVWRSHRCLHALPLSAWRASVGHVRCAWRATEEEYSGLRCSAARRNFTHSGAAARSHAPRCCCCAPLYRALRACLSAKHSVSIGGTYSCRRRASRSGRCWNGGITAAFWRGSPSDSINAPAARASKRNCVRAFWRSISADSSLYAPHFMARLRTRRSGRHQSISTSCAVSRRRIAAHVSRTGFHRARGALPSRRAFHRRVRKFLRSALPSFVLYGARSPSRGWRRYLAAQATAGFVALCARAAGIKREHCACAAGHRLRACRALRRRVCTPRGIESASVVTCVRVSAWHRDAWENHICRHRACGDGVCCGRAGTFPACYLRCCAGRRQRRAWRRRTAQHMGWRDATAPPCWHQRDMRMAWRVPSLRLLATSAVMVYRRFRWRNAGALPPYGAHRRASNAAASATLARARRAIAYRLRNSRCVSLGISCGFARLLRRRLATAPSLLFSRSSCFICVLEVGGDSWYLSARWLYQRLCILARRAGVIISATGETRGGWARIALLGARLGGVSRNTSTWRARTRHAAANRRYPLGGAHSRLYAHHCRSLPRRAAPPSHRAISSALHRAGMRTPCWYRIARRRRTPSLFRAASTGFGVNAVGEHAAPRAHRLAEAWRSRRTRAGMGAARCSHARRAGAQISYPAGVPRDGLEEERLRWRPYFAAFPHRTLPPLR